MSPVAPALQADSLLAKPSREPHILKGTVQIKVSQGHPPSEGSEGEPLLVSSSFGVCLQPWSSVACRCITLCPPSPWVSLLCLPSVHVCLCDWISFYKDTSCTEVFPGGSVVKNLPANAGDLGSIPELERLPWRRKWQLTPVFLPGEFHEQRSLADVSQWGQKWGRHNLVTQKQQVIPQLTWLLLSRHCIQIHSHSEVLSVRNITFLKKLLLLLFWLCCTYFWTIAHRTPLSMGFPRQEYWSGFHSLLQGIFLTQG